MSRLKEYSVTSTDYSRLSPLASVPPGFSTMCIAIQDLDGICVLHHDNGTLDTIRRAIRETWLKGIKGEWAVCGTGWMFHLKGYPFQRIQSSSSSLQVRQMICLILQRLYSIGWKIVVSCYLSRVYDGSTMFFKKTTSNCLSIHPFLCVGLHDTDRLQIINLPSQLVEPIKQTIQQFWPKGVRRETSTDNVLKIKLSGYPWANKGSQSAMAKVLVQNVISTLQRYQWRYIVNVSPDSTADSLYFRYDPEASPGQAPSFCTISLNRKDRLRVIGAPEHIVNIIRSVIQMVWSHGNIIKERDHHGSWEFTISGKPWESSNEESVMARYLILRILRAMLEQGWHSTAVFRLFWGPLTAKSVFVFQQREPNLSPMMCLSLNDNDKFRLINMPAQLVELFKDTLLSRWSEGIQEEKILNLSFGNVQQLELNGFLWSGEFKHVGYHVRSFLCNIIEVFMRQGWKVLLAGDVSAKNDNKTSEARFAPVDVYSFWFIYEPHTTQQPTTTASTSYPLTEPMYAVFPSSFPEPNEAPPPYHQATGWSTSEYKN